MSTARNSKDIDKAIASVEGSDNVKGTEDRTEKEQVTTEVTASVEGSDTRAVNEEGAGRIEANQVDSGASGEETIDRNVETRAYLLDNLSGPTYVVDHISSIQADEQDSNSETEEEIDRNAEIARVFLQQASEADLRRLCESRDKELQQGK